MKEELEQESRKRLEAQQRAEQLEQEREEHSGVQQDAERLGQERQQLIEDLATEREQRLATQQQAEHSEEERRRRGVPANRRRRGSARHHPGLGPGHVSRALAQRAQDEQEQDDDRVMEELEREQTEVSGVQQEAERLRQERQRLAEDLERRREERVEVQSRADRQEQELARLEQELERSKAELELQKRAPSRTASRARRPWWRRPILVVGLLLGVLIAWFTSLVVALNMLAA